MDRGHTSFEDVFFTDKVSTALVMEDSWDMVMVVDRSIWEVFLNQGSSSATMTFFPQGELDTMVLTTDGLNEGVVVSCVVEGLNSTWTNQASKDGIVYGNVTIEPPEGSNSTQAMRRDMMGRLY